MKINKKLGVLATSAAVALGANAADVTGYIPVTISGTFTVGITKANAAGTKQTYSTKSTAVNNKGVLALLYSWQAIDVAPAVPAALAAGDTLDILWDYTIQAPVTGELVILNKSGVLVYDPSKAGAHTFVVGAAGLKPADMGGVPNSPSDWIYPVVTGGSTVILPVGTGANFYDTTLGAGTITYDFTGAFTLDDADLYGTTSISPAHVQAQGKGTGSSVYNATGVQNKVAFRFDAYGSEEEIYGGTVAGTGSSTAAFDLTISSGAPASAGPVFTGLVPL